MVAEAVVVVAFRININYPILGFQGLLLLTFKQYDIFFITHTQTQFIMHSEYDSFIFKKNMH